VPLITHQAVDVRRSDNFPVHLSQQERVLTPLHTGKHSRKSVNLSLSRNLLASDYLSLLFGKEIDEFLQII